MKAIKYLELGVGWDEIVFLFKNKVTRLYTYLNQSIRKRKSLIDDNRKIVKTFS